MLLSRLRNHSTKCPVTLKNRHSKMTAPLFQPPLMPEMRKHRSEWRNSLEAQRWYFKPRNFTIPLHVVETRAGQALERKLTADISHPDSSSRLSSGIHTVPDCDGNTIPLYSQLLSFLHTSSRGSPCPRRWELRNTSQLLQGLLNQT